MAKTVSTFVLITVLTALLMALSIALARHGYASFGALGAAVTVGLRRGGLIAPVLILPLSIPVMIFGVGMTDPLAGGGATLFLIALSLVVTAFSPFAAALALRVAGE